MVGSAGLWLRLGVRSRSFPGTVRAVAGVHGAFVRAAEKVHVVDGRVRNGLAFRVNDTCARGRGSPHQGAQRG